jgi:heat shock protein HslJ
MIKPGGRSMHRLRSILFAALVFVTAGSATIAGAQTPEAVEGDAFTGTNWELVSIEVEAGSAIEIGNPGDYTLQFIEAGSMVMGADCNTALAQYQLDGESITVTPGPMTLALCPEGSQSDLFVASVAAATSITMNDNGHLILAPGEGAADGVGTLTFQRSLIGTYWQWTVFQSSDESEIVPEDPSRYTIEFIDDHTVAIGVDCNRGRGVYTRNGSEITIDIQMLTRAYCGEDSLHDQYLEFLDQAVSFVFADGGLHLSFPMDAGVMSFEPIAYGPAETDDEG